MRQHTTNYQDTFIAVAEDCPAAEAAVPQRKKNGEDTVATLQFNLLWEHPYTLTSDDILFQVYARRNGIRPADLDQEKAKFFSKGQPCFRASPLTKRYGWGIHADHEGKMALYARESEEYQRFLSDPGISVVRAMKSKR